jgi:hypothetical protein
MGMSQERLRANYFRSAPRGLRNLGTLTASGAFFSMSGQHFRVRVWEKIDHDSSEIYFCLLYLDQRLR